MQGPAFDRSQGSFGNAGFLQLVTSPLDPAFRPQDNWWAFVAERCRCVDHDRAQYAPILLCALPRKVSEEVWFHHWFAPEGLNPVISLVAFSALRELGTTAKQLLPPQRGKERPLAREYNAMCDDAGPWDCRRIYRGDYFIRFLALLSILSVCAFVSLNGNMWTGDLFAECDAHFFSVLGLLIGGGFGSKSFVATIRQDWGQQRG